MARHRRKNKCRDFGLMSAIQEHRGCHCKLRHAWLITEALGLEVEKGGSLGHTPSLEGRYDALVECH